MPSQFWVQHSFCFHVLLHRVVTTFSFNVSLNREEKEMNIRIIVFFVIVYVTCVYLKVLADVFLQQLNIIWGRTGSAILCVCVFVCVCFRSQPCVLGCFMRLGRLQLVWAEPWARGKEGWRKKKKGLSFLFLVFGSTIFTNTILIKCTLK